MESSADTDTGLDVDVADAFVLPCGVQAATITVNAKPTATHRMRILLDQTVEQTSTVPRPRLKRRCSTVPTNGGRPDKTAPCGENAVAARRHRDR